MPSFTESLEEAIHRALEYASERRQEFATLEHLLLSLIDDPDASAVMRARGEYGCAAQTAYSIY